MAGGRSKKKSVSRKTSTNKQKGVSDTDIIPERKLQKDLQSNDTEKDGKRRDAISVNKLTLKADESSTSPLASKYVPPFSRPGKTSGKTEEKSLPSSQSTSSLTRKRRNQPATGASILETKSSDFDGSDGENDNSVKLIQKEELIDLINPIPSKQPKFCSVNELNQDECIEEGLKEIAIVQEFIEKVKNGCSSEPSRTSYVECTTISEGTANALAKKEAQSTTEETSIDDLVKACLTYLVEKVEENLLATGELSTTDHDKGLELLNNEDISVSRQMDLQQPITLPCKREIHPSKTIIADVGEEMDYEFLMDCTDSQLVDGTDVSNGHCRIQATSAIHDGPGPIPVVVEDGSNLIKELMKEVSSLKHFLVVTWNKYEQIKKRN